jgi:DNA (cytosine-5)-methyltransferase 1
MVGETQYAAKKRRKLLRVKEHYRNESTGVEMEKTFAEFFSGIGLMRLGLEACGWQLRFANDIDPEKCKMYRAHFPDAGEHLVEGDIHDLDASSLPTVALATASFPCNDLSIAGEMEGLGGKQSSAFWGFVRLLQDMGDRRPPLILIENVVGFLMSNEGTDFSNALIALNRLGYSVDAFIIDAARFVPQSRPRLFVVGIPNSAGVFERSLHFYQSDVRSKALADFILRHPEIRWALRRLPDLPTHAKTLEDILEDLPDGAPEWGSRERADYLLNPMSARHRQIADKMIAQKKWSYGTVFRRIRHGKSMAELRTDGLAGCLRTPRGGSGRQILFKAGYGKHFARLLTPRECARLMGADDYAIDVPLNQALFGFGDAVCVPVIKWIADNYLNPVFSELLQAHRKKEVVYA